MKKQKKPIFLVLLLAAGFTGVALMNRPAKGLDDHKPQGEQAPESKDAVAGNVADTMKEAKPLVKNKSHGRGGPQRPGSENLPSILKIQEKPYKPKPNESSTSTQWYTEQSARNTPIK